MRIRGVVTFSVGILVLCIITIVHFAEWGGNLTQGTVSSESTTKWSNLTATSSSASRDVLITSSNDGEGIITSRRHHVLPAQDKDNLSSGDVHHHPPALTNATMRSEETNNVTTENPSTPAAAAFKRRTTESAYFTLIAGITPSTSLPLKDPHSYLGYLLNLAVMVYMLETLGSTMDIVLLVRLKHAVKEKTLPEAQVRFFDKLQVRIEYLPQQEDDEWNSYMMEKFNILKFHEYKRILFLDADVMPLCNLDHHFRMSIEREVFGPNLVFAYRNEPAQGGFFMLSPGKSDWDTYLKVPPYTNETVGFGQPLLTNTTTHYAEGTTSNFTSWNWHGAGQDQGMLYHWVRFVKKNVTIVNKSRVQKWVNGKLVEELHDFNITCPNLLLDVERPFRMSYTPVYTDFYHFTGMKKPWMNANWTELSEWTMMHNNNETTTTIRNPFLLWGVSLRAAWKRYDLGSVKELVENATEDKDIPLVEMYLKS